MPIAKAYSTGNKPNEIVTPSDFSATGDGVTDDASELDLFFANGGMLRLEGTYRTTGEHTIPDNTVLDMTNGKLIGDTGKTILTLGSNVTIINGEIDGSASSYVVDSKGIYAAGTSDVASTAPVYKENITIIGTKFTGIGDYAFEGRYLRNCWLINVEMKNIGYSGAFFYSCINCHVAGERTFMDNFYGETTSGQLNAYAVTFTRKINDSDTTRYPAPFRCSVRDITVSNVPTWQALDTHGGEYITFSGNKLYNCKRGIVLTGSTNLGNKECIVTDNHIRNDLSGTNSDGSSKREEAIWVVGATGANIADSATIKNNTIINHGDNLGSSTQAILVQGAQDTVVTGNTLRDCWGAGVAVTNDCTHTVVRNNEVETLQLPSGASFTFAIVFRNDTTDPIVDNNYLEDMDYGVYQGSLTTTGGKCVNNTIDVGTTAVTLPAGWTSANNN